MSIETTILAQNIIAESVDSSWAYSDKKKGAGYHKTGNTVHTYLYETIDFIGTIKLQATLELYPGDNDWVDVEGTLKEGQNDSTVFQSGAATGTFSGNFIWIRAAYNLQNGTITSLRFNH